MSSSDTTVVVTGANGFVGYRISELLARRGAHVRAVVRRAGTAPELAGIEEAVGDFTDRDFAKAAVSGAGSVVSTVHPMGSDRATQHRIGVLGTSGLARAALAAGAERFIHVSTAAVTKRDADAALAELEGITRVLLRPPAILGPGASSTWNTLRPDAMRDDVQARHAIPEATFAWVHVDDLAQVAADLAVGLVPDGAEPEAGPAAGGCVALNVAAGGATLRDYVGAVTAALAVDPTWDDAPAWTGQILAGRARRWGWEPRVDLATALAELADGLTG